MQFSVTRRELLRTLGVGAAGAALAACQPQIVEKEVVVKEVVEVEKEVTRVVEVAPADKPIVELLIHCPQNVSFGEWFGDAWDQNVGAFRSENPHIRQKLERTAGWTNEYFPKILAHVAAGTLGDIVWTPARHMSNLGWAIEYGIVRDLTPLVEATNYDLTQFYPGVVAAGSWDGKFYFMPIIDEPVCPVIAYNKTMNEEMGLDEPQLDWDYMQLTDWAVSATTDDMWGYHWGHMSAIPFPAAGQYRQFGAQIMSEDGSTVLPGDSSEAIKTVLGWRHDLIYKHGTMPVPGPEFNVGDMFAAEKLMSLTIWPVWINQLRVTTVGDKFDLGFIYAPLDKQGAKRRSLLNDHTFAVSNASKNAEDSFTWLQWMSSKEFCIQGMLAGKAPPNGRPDVFQDERAMRLNPGVELLSPIMDEIEADFFLANYRGWEFDREWGAQADLVMLDKIGIDEAVDNIKKNCQAIVDKEPA